MVFSVACAIELRTPLRVGQKCTIHPRSQIAQIGIGRHGIAGRVIDGYLWVASGECIHRIQHTLIVCPGCTTICRKVIAKIA